MSGRLVSGIIPARAGFTPTMQAENPASADHPRTRGVYIPLPVSQIPKAGSSPHARGLRYPERDSERSVADHPRTRGVYLEMAVDLFAASGSSPHARGLRQRPPTALFRHRIIPARAGFTEVWLRLWLPGTDHPRTRGVYPAFAVVGDGVGGSSPHARGLPQTQAVLEHGRRIIPARAGFTVVVCAPGWVRWDHPRTRGVYFPVGVLVRVNGRIIPARAGFTTVAWRPIPGLSDHPRTRGVYATISVDDSLQ